MKRRYVVAITLLGLAGCATSVPGPATTRSVTSGDSTLLEAERVEAANEPICRYEKETGSMMRKRVCRTRAEIDEARTKSQQVLKELDESGIAINTD
jgi:hypothetical protein